MSVATWTKILAIAIVVIVLLYIMSVLELYTQLSRYKSYWQRQNSGIVSPDYVALGDSTAQGIGAASPAKGYVGLITNHLGEDRSQPVQTVNLSKSGATVSDVLHEQIPALNELKLRPSTIVTIEIGANDMNTFDAAVFETQMDELMAQLPKQTLISDIPYFGDSRHRGSEVNVEAANEIMYRLADKHDFRLVPLHERMRQNGGLKTLAVDWFHPSNYAYRENWTKVFLERIESGQ